MCENKEIKSFFDTEDAFWSGYWEIRSANSVVSDYMDNHHANYEQFKKDINIHGAEKAFEIWVECHSEGSAARGNYNAPQVKFKSILNSISNEIAPIC